MALHELHAQPHSDESVRSDKARCAPAPPHAALQERSATTPPPPPDAVAPNLDAAHIAPASWDAAQLAVWCAELVCYLWYSPASLLPTRPTKPSAPLHARSGSANTRPTPGTHAPSRMQLYPTERFVDFVKDILRMTQVLRSVLHLSLLYIYRLKLRHDTIKGQPGSEYRLFLTSLILANKFLDDHTYTNKTWADISHIPLQEITKMELQFWGGIDTNANASPAEYEWWERTLERLVELRTMDLRWLAWSESSSLLSTPSPVSSPGAYLTARSVSPMVGVSGHGHASWAPASKRHSRHSPGSYLGKRQHGSESMPHSDPPHKQRRGRGSLSMSTRPLLPYDPSVIMPWAGVPLSTAASTGALPQSMTSATGPSPLHVQPEWPVPCTNSSSSINMDLFMPVESYSPYLDNHLTTQTAPTMLGYYRLAAGYPYGIPTWKPLGAPTQAHGAVSGLNTPGHSTYASSESPCASSVTPTYGGMYTVPPLSNDALGQWPEIAPEPGLPLNFPDTMASALPDTPSTMLYPILPPY